MLHFYEVNFGVEIRQNIGQMSSVKAKKKDVSFCYYEDGLLKVVVTPSTPSLLNLMLMYIFTRIPGKHKFNIYI